MAAGKVVVLGGLLCCPLFPAPPPGGGGQPSGLSLSLSHSPVGRGGAARRSNCSRCLALAHCLRRSRQLGGTASSLPSQWERMASSCRARIFWCLPRLPAAGGRPQPTTQARKLCRIGRDMHVVLFVWLVTRYLGATLRHGQFNMPDARWAPHGLAATGALTKDPRLPMHFGYQRDHASMRGPNSVDSPSPLRPSPLVSLDPHLRTPSPIRR